MNSTDDLAPTLKEIAARPAPDPNEQAHQIILQQLVCHYIAALGGLGMDTDSARSRLLASCLENITVGVLGETEKETEDRTELQQALVERSIRYFFKGVPVA